MNAQIDSINKHHGETILNSTFHSFNGYRTLRRETLRRETVRREFNISRTLRREDTMSGGFLS